MKIHILFIASLFVVSCSHNPHKAEKIETKLDRSETVSGAQSMGLKEGNMVVQEKTEIREKLRDLQNTVYGLEDAVYGNRKRDTKGMYGDLRTCRSKLASRQYGGSGTLVWAEPLDRVTDKEEEMQLGLDESNQLVGVKEEFLRDRINRFQGYRKILQKRQDEFAESLEDCRAELKNKNKDIDTSADGSKRVSITETSKLALEREALNEYMCKYARSGASLQSLMMNAFGRGWVSVSDYQPDSRMLSVTIRDDQGAEKSNGMMIGSWRLAFDEGVITLNDILSGAKDARLQAWTGNAKCAGLVAGKWSP